MTILAAVISALLGLVALLHMFWGFGIWVPIRDEARLTRTVVGARGVTRMPGPIPCFLVASGLLFVALAVWLPPGILHAALLWPAMAIFVGRGLMTYAGCWRRLSPVQPFARYDRLIYGPLCLALGAGLLLIIKGGA